MKKMYSGQLFALLFLSGAWSVICLPALYGSGQMIGVVIVCILQCLMCLPMLYLSEHGVFLTGLAKKHRILGLLYVFFFLLWGGRGFSALRDTVSNVSVSGNIHTADCYLSVYKLSRTPCCVTVRTDGAGNLPCFHARTDAGRAGRNRCHPPDPSHKRHITGWLLLFLSGR
jgi:hypothetical protein